MKPVGAMMSEKFEVDERWVLADVWLKVIHPRVTPRDP